MSSSSSEELSVPLAAKLRALREVVKQRWRAWRKGAREPKAFAFLHVRPGYVRGYAALPDAPLAGGGWLVLLYRLPQTGARVWAQAVSLADADRKRLAAAVRLQPLDEKRYFAGNDADMPAPFADPWLTALRGPLGDADVGADAALLTRALAAAELTCGHANDTEWQTIHVQ